MTATDYVRQLGPADYRAMSRLRASCTTHAGAAVTSFTSTPLLGINSVYQNAPHAVFGKFVDNRLTAFICCFAKPEFWVLDLMISSGQPADLQECLEQCLQHYESQGIRCFYYAFPAKWARAYRKFWREGAPSLRKYVIEDIALLERGKRVTDPWIWENILHETIVVSADLQLRRSTCPTT